MTLNETRWQRRLHNAGGDKKTKHPYVAIDSKLSGGQPIVRGSRIKVLDIAVRYELIGMSADRIVDEYPHLKLEQIHDALSYYYEHKTTLDKEYKDDQNVITQLKKQYPSKLRAKLAWKSTPTKTSRPPSSMDFGDARLRSILLLNLATAVNPINSICQKPMRACTDSQYPKIIQLPEYRLYLDLSAINLKIWILVKLICTTSLGFS